MTLNIFMIMKKRHIKRFCEDKLKDIRDLDEKRMKDEKLVNASEIYDSNSNVIYVNKGEGSMGDWIFDSACCFHKCLNKELFDTYKPYNGSDVMMANGSRRKVIEKRIIKMKMYDRVIQTVGDVRFVYSFRKNLI